jgi:hypothetical protein
LGIQKFTPSNENDESSFGRWGQVKSAYKTIKDNPKKYFQDTTYIDFNEVPGLLMAEKNDPIHTTNQSAYLIAKIYSELILSRITGASSK